MALSVSPSRKIYYVFSEAGGEVEAMFDEHDNMFSYWYCNDAHWRNEYFGHFMKQLGVEVIVASRHPEIYERLFQILKRELIKDGNWNEEDE